MTSNIQGAYDTTNEALKTTWDFVTKGLKYTVEQHNKGLKGSKWDGSTVRTNDLDKWKNCKETATNVEIAYVGGLINCSPGASAAGPLAVFMCALKDGIKGFIDPDTVWCIVEINEFVETELIGDS